MQQSSQAKIYVFDAYGTLFDVHSAVAHYAKQIGENASALSQLWRTKQLEYTWVRSLMQEYRDFEKVTADSLDFALAFYGIEESSLRSNLLAAYDELSLYPEVREVLQGLRAGGHRTAILSNGTMKMLESAVESSSIGDLLDVIISVDALKIYKPRAEVYRLCTDYFRAEPSEVSFQSSNRWDIAGAKRFGFGCIWVNRSGQPNEYLSTDADMHAVDLRVLSEVSSGDV